MVMTRFFSEKLPDHQNDIQYINFKPQWFLRTYPSWRPNEGKALGVPLFVTKKVYVRQRPKDWVLSDKHSTVGQGRHPGWYAFEHGPCAPIQPNWYKWFGRAPFPPNSKNALRDGCFLFSVSKNLKNIGGGFKYFFTPNLGEDEPILTISTGLNQTTN